MTRKLTSAERARIARAASRAKYKRIAQEKDDVVRRDEDVEDIEEPEDMGEGEMSDDTKEEARVRANRRAKILRARRRMIAQEMDPEDDMDDEMDDEDDELDKAKEAARRKAMAVIRKARRARRSKRAQSVSDDLKDVDGGKSPESDPNRPSDDLVDPDEDPNAGLESTPPSSVNEAEEKMYAAARLVDAQIAHKVIPPTSDRLKVASFIARKHTLPEIKFAADQLCSVGNAGKTAGSVRVVKRSSVSPAAKSRNSGGDDLLSAFSLI